MKSIYFLSPIVLAALAWASVHPPVAELQPRSVASGATTSDPGIAPHATAVSTLMEAHRPPIPLMRNARVLATAAATPEVAVADADVQPPDNLDVGTAKAAIEADGYKRVSVLGRGGNGSWRAKAYRGQTEVELIVDGAGRVSAR
jgi:hypothetical protein